MAEQKIKILLVEDYKIIQIATKMQLENVNCIVDIASSGEEALILSNKKSYDLIFMDIGLGDTDGYTVTEKIHASSVKNATTPIIALTAHADREVNNLTKKASMDGYLVKPLTKEVALDIFKKHIKH